MDEVRADRLWQRRVRVESERMASGSLGGQEDLMRLEEGLNRAMYATTNDLYYGEVRHRRPGSLSASLERELEILRDRRKRAEKEVKRLKAVLEALG